MKTRMITLFVLAALLLSLLAACGSEPSVLSSEEVQKIALKAAGLSASDVDDIHTHVATYQEAPCFSVHITIGTEEYEYLIDAYSGEVLSANPIG